MGHLKAFTAQAALDELCGLLGALEGDVVVHTEEGELLLRRHADRIEIFDAPWSISVEALRRRLG